MTSHQELTKQESKFIIRNMTDDVTGFISLQGSIGAGKSTILDAIKRYIIKHNISVDDIDIKSNNKDYFLVINEPSTEWSKELYSTAKYNEINFGSIPENASQAESSLSQSCSSGTCTPIKKSSLLSLFYDDMERNGLMFQVHAFTTRLELIIEQLNTIKKHGPDVRVHVICERSLRTDKLFFYNLYKSGVIRNVEWEVYNRFHTLICEEVMKMENMMLYVKTSPSKCLSRIKKRNRLSEMNKKDDDYEKTPFSREDSQRESSHEKDSCAIPLDYLENLETEHDNMINEFKSIKGNSVLEIDLNDEMNLDEIDGVVSNLMLKILNHLSL